MATQREDFTEKIGYKKPDAAVHKLEDKEGKVPQKRETVAGLKKEEIIDTLPTKETVPIPKMLEEKEVPLPPKKE